MTCPSCGGDTSVVDTVHYDSDNRVWRRRVCEDCGERFSTDERIREGSGAPPAGG